MKPYEVTTYGPNATLRRPRRSRRVTFESAELTDGEFNTP